MKRSDAIVAAARIVFCDSNFDEAKVTFGFMGMYKSKYISDRVYVHEMDKVQGETIEAFEKRLQGAISENKKLRKEMRRYRELGSGPALQVRISLDEFVSQGIALVDCWTFEDQISVLARTGRSIALSFCNDAEGDEAHVEIPSSFVKLLAKYGFSLRFVIG